MNAIVVYKKIDNYLSIKKNKSEIVPFVGVSLQFQGLLPFVATASAAVMARGCRSLSNRSMLSVDLPLPKEN
jgi:hypothetical protein